MRNELAGLDVSRETFAGLELYAAELAKWQKAINLVGPDTMGALWDRHIRDSLQLLPWLEGRVRIADLGSGAGLPGMILAIALREKPGAMVYLVESNAKKVSFLRHVAVTTQAPVEVVHARIEQAVPRLQNVDIVTARALAPLRGLLGWAEPLLKSGATGLFHKGRDLQSELDEASRFWDFDHEVIPSLVAPESSLVKVTAIRPRNAGQRAP